MVKAASLKTCICATIRAKASAVDSSSSLMLLAMDTKERMSRSKVPVRPSMSPMVLCQFSATFIATSVAPIACSTWTATSLAVPDTLPRIKSKATPTSLPVFPAASAILVTISPTAASKSFAIQIWLFSASFFSSSSTSLARSGPKKSAMAWVRSAMAWNESFSSLASMSPEYLSLRPKVRPKPPVA